MCQTNVRDVESGNKVSDVQPKLHTGNETKKAINMDEALSRISKE